MAAAKRRKNCAARASRCVARSRPSTVEAGWNSGGAQCDARPVCFCHADQALRLLISLAYGYSFWIPACVVFQLNDVGRRACTPWANGVVYQPHHCARIEACERSASFNRFINEANMEYRHLGASGFKVPVLSFGTG